MLPECGHTDRSPRAFHLDELALFLKHFSLRFQLITYAVAPGNAHGRAFAAGAGVAVGFAGGLAAVDVREGDALKVRGCAEVLVIYVPPGLRPPGIALVGRLYQVLYVVHYKT